jgi:SAM-dependent methyltransferase
MRPDMVAGIDEPSFLQRQYTTTERLDTRISVWRPPPDGRTPQNVALEALAAIGPGRLLEVGCGTGAFAQRMAAELGCEVVAVDQSPQMVETTRACGIDARLGDVQHLAFANGEFDAAVAAWMLYHVADIDRGLAELARVLRPGGALVAITNGARHLAELWSALGVEYGTAGFRSENGEELLAPHFARVERHDLQTTAHFPDRRAAAAYLASLGREEIPPELAARLPEPFEARGAPTVFVAC